MTHVVINGWFREQLASGSGQYLHHVLDHLPAIDRETRLSVLIPSEDRDSLQARWPDVYVVHVKIPRLPKNLAKLWWEQISVPYAAKRLRADVLWVPYWGAPLWQPRPTVVTVHDLIPSLLPAYRGGVLQRLYTALVSVTARRARAVLTISRASARDIETHLHIPATKIHAVHHGSTTKATGAIVPDDMNRVRVKYDLPDRYFLYLGGFDVRKNVSAILAAYRSYLDRGGSDQIKLVIAGQIPGQTSEFVPDPIEMVAESGLDDQVRFCGWVEEKDKPALYAGATAYIFPSLYEGFGMTIVEAMTAGAPVITSNQ